MGLAPRVACAEHGAAAAQVPWAEPDSRLTSGFEMECAWPAAVASQKTMGGFPRIAWRTAGHIARRVAARLESSMPCMFDGPTAIGVDETSHRKGHTYITVAVDHKRRRVAWAHDGYGKEVPGLFLRRLTDEQRASIKAVTGDGAKWIDASVKERPSNAGRVPDSFHIVSRMSDAPDQVRKRVRNQARRGNDKTATEAMRGVRYAVPKNPEDLTERQDTDPRGPALPVMATQGTPRDAPAPAHRTSRGQAETMDLPGLPQPHPRDRRIIHCPSTPGTIQLPKFEFCLRIESGQIKQRCCPHFAKAPTIRRELMHRVQWRTADTAPRHRRSHSPLTRAGQAR